MIKKLFSRSGRGFTLIELLVVVSIIAILSGVVLSSLGESRSKARDAVRISDLSQLQLALTLFFDRCGEYPRNIPAGSSLTTSLTAATCPSGINLGSFISQIPTPPSGTSQTYYNTTIFYTANRVNGLGVNYVLVAALESNNSAMAKSLLASSIPTPSASNWWPGANAAPFSYCGAQNGGYYYYCIGPN